MASKSKKQPTGIHVDVLSGSFAVGWEMDGARYHYWAKDDILTPSSDIFYKNCALQLQPSDEGYFRTRHLNITSNIDLIAKVRAFAIENDLITEGRQRSLDREKQADEKRQADFTKSVLGDVRRFASSINEPIDSLSDDDLLAGLRRVFATASQSRAAA